MEDPTSVLTADFVGGMGTDVVANVVTMLGVALLWSLKKLCDREKKCKSRCHTCCLDVEMVDRTIRADRPPSVSVDGPEGSPV